MARERRKTGAARTQRCRRRAMAAYPNLANPYTLWVEAHDLLGGSLGRGKKP